MAAKRKKKTQKTEAEQAGPILLEGGAKYHWGVEPSGTEVKEIRRGQRLDEKFPWAGEGHVYEVEVVVERVGEDGKTRERTLSMAEKEFHPGYRPEEVVRQFETMTELIELNREKNLGLRITPTIRLRRREGEAPTLVLTKLELVELEDLTREQVAEYAEDRNRQIAVLEREGYDVDFPSFFKQIDPETGMVVAVLGDFGGVERIKGLG